jgi:hypothetical protein
MQRSLIPILGGCITAVMFAVPKPAAATTAAAPAVHYGETDAGMVQEVGRRYWRGRRYVRPYAYGYGYRPYYRPYGYYGYYGRPYGYYRPYAYYGGPYAYYGGYGYPYWRPGISFGFSF